MYNVSLTQPKQKAISSGNPWLHLFDNMISDGFFNQNFRSSVATIREEENEFVVEAEMPGARKEDMKIKVKSNTLEISSTGEKGKKDENQRYAYHFQLSLPEAADTNSDIKAELERGILTLRIPKKTEASAREIEIHESK